MELIVDNRILLALSEITGSEERGLDKIFVFRKKGEAPVFFASNGYIALKIEQTEPEFDFEKEENYVLEIPEMFKKILKFNKKEENEAMNKTIFAEDGEKIKASFYNKMPFELRFTNPETKKFEALPDVFKQDTTEQRAFTFNPVLAGNLAKALVKLGFKPMQTFLLGERVMHGTKENEDFIAEYVLMGGVADEE